MVKRRQRGSRQEPVHLHKRHLACHLLLQRLVELLQRCVGWILSIIIAVRIDILYLRPCGVDIPLVVPKIDVEERLLRVNRLRLGNIVTPRETINEFGKCAAIGSECVRCFAGVVEMRHCKIAREGPVERRERIHVLLHGGEHCIRRDEIGWRGIAYPIRCSRFNPAAHDAKFHIGERRFV